MATVHRAETRGLAGFTRPVALKRLMPHVASDPLMVQSFVHEARLASHLHHSNVAQTYDLGKVEDTYFIAMEYVPGPTLTQILRQSIAAAGPVPLAIVLTILGQICDALDHAHNLCDDSGKPLGIIHRDVSPANVIVSNTGIVKLIDFGIAKGAGSEQTQAGLIKGKFAYMAPEYLAGQLDLRADLFGLGVIAHELLTGRPLFHAKNDFDTLVRLRDMPIQPPSRWNQEITPEFDDIVMTALQRSPELRWQNAAAMRTAITNVIRSLGTPVTNQQVLDWVEWAFEQVPRKEDSDESSSPTITVDQEDDELEQFDPPIDLPTTVAPGNLATDEPETKVVRKQAKARRSHPTTAKVNVPATVGRGWLLLIALLVIAGFAWAELADAARTLYEWCVE